MSDEAVERMLRSPRGFTEAAAGCGKTQLLSSIVADARFGRQLVLTHTHAGVAALRKRLTSRGVAAGSYHLDTIAGWCLRWATAYPSISGYITSPDKLPDWSIAHDGARRIIDTRIGRMVLQASYSGVLVDEYQDCTKQQHELVEGLAEVLPCRAVGDPLQAIFGFRGNPSVSWTDVQSSFDMLPPLEEPWRWRNAGQNRNLGEWLVRARRELRDEKRLSISEKDPVRWVLHQNEQEWATVCRAAQAPGESTVGIVKWPNEAQALAKPLGGRWPVVERFDDDGLLKCAGSVATSNGPNAVSALFDFLRARITGVGPALDGIVRAVREGRTASRFRNHREHLRRIEALAKAPSPETALSMVEGVLAEKKWVLYRPECVHQLRAALRELAGRALSELPEAVAEARTSARHRGRLTHRRTLGTSLLVKGLEFDHAVVLTPDALSVRELYVAITRGSKSLTIVSRGRTITPREF